MSKFFAFASKQKKKVNSNNSIKGLHSGHFTIILSRKSTLKQWLITIFCYAVAVLGLLESSYLGQVHTILTLDIISKKYVLDDRTGKIPHCVILGA